MNYDSVGDKITLADVADDPVISYIVAVHIDGEYWDFGINATSKKDAIEEALVLAADIAESLYLEDAKIEVTECWEEEE